jgi:hypothetical protein
MSVDKELLSPDAGHFAVKASGIPHKEEKQWLKRLKLLT